MTKRRLLRASLLMVLLAAFAVWLEPTRVVWGWLRGEAFYQGRPTSWWREELPRWKCIQAGDCWWGEEIWARDKDHLQELLEWLGCQQKLMKTGRPKIVSGDLEAESVLRALQDDRSNALRELAVLGLACVRLNKDYLREHPNE